MNYTKLLEQFDEEFIRDDGLLEKYDAPDIKTFLLQSHIQSLQKLHNEVGEMKRTDDTQMSEDHIYDEAITNIQNKLTKEIEALQALMK